jgi:hypothetical protein
MVIIKAYRWKGPSVLGIFLFPEKNVNAYALKPIKTIHRNA